MLKCDLCGEGKYSKWYKLAKHVAYQHGMEIINNDTARCWCGMALGMYHDLPVEQHNPLSLHLKNRGGVATHFLECQLGVKQ